jgi:hypothetical protein
MKNMSYVHRIVYTVSSSITHTINGGFEYVSVSGHSISSMVIHMHDCWDRCDEPKTNEPELSM